MRTMWGSEGCGSSRAVVLAAAAVLVLCAMPHGAWAQGSSLESETVDRLMMHPPFPGGGGEDSSTPPWLKKFSLMGKYVDPAGNDSKRLEDYNIQSGVDGELAVEQDWEENRSLSIDAFGQSGEEQGYFIGDYGKLGQYSLLVDVEAWQEFYNQRTTRAVPLAQQFFPFTNDSDVLFGDDEPSAHWMTVGGTFDYKFDEYVHDLYLDFHYRSVNGDETLLKGGTIDDPSAVVAGSGPGTTAFDYPGRKGVDYKTYSGFVGGRSQLLGINWQTDATYAYHRIRSDVTEANWGTNFSSTELDIFRQESDVQVAKYDLVGSRNLNPNVFVYGGYLFAYERNDPSPSQDVEDGVDPVLRSIQTRSTSSGGINRFGNTLSLGMLYRPVSRVLVTLDTRAMGHIQRGDLTQVRDEFMLATGDVGTVANTGDRNTVNSTTTLAADWRPMHRLRLRANGRYQYRWNDISSSQDFNYVQVEIPGIEDYTNTYNNIHAGVSGRWRFRRGRMVEIGYQYLYENVHVSVEQVVDNYIWPGYSRQRHRPYLKASGRITDGLNAQLRFQWVNERRGLRAPITQPESFATDPGGTDFRLRGWAVIPMLTYQPSEHWTSYGTFSIAQQNFNVLDQDFLLPFEQSFDYDALTETVSAGVGYIPSEMWSMQAAYSFFNSGDSVQNTGHNGSIFGNVHVTDGWWVRGGFRYLHYRQAETDLNDYRAAIPYLGVVGSW